MTTIITKRISMEIKKIASDKTDDITLVPVSEENLQKLIGSFKGFENSPYAEGEYKIDIEIPDGYPFKPPKARFITPVWHPNISSASGYICLDLLREDKWAPALSMKNLLTSIKALLILAEPNDPQDAVVASQYVQNRQLFETTAAYWNHVFAQGRHSHDFDEMNEKVQISMRKTGSDKFKAIHQLSMTNWQCQ